MRNMILGVVLGVFLIYGYDVYKKTKEVETSVPQVGQILTFNEYTPSIVWYMNSSCPACQSEYEFFKQVSKDYSSKLVIINRENPIFITSYLRDKGIVSKTILHPDQLKRTDTKYIPFIVLMKDGKIYKTFIGKTQEKDRKEIMDFLSSCCTI